MRKTPLVRQAAQAYSDWQLERSVRGIFKNPDVWVRALRVKKPEMATLETTDGLKIRFRQNVWDARIIREAFIRKDYLQHCRLPPNPVIVDIGGYIGDFSIYAAHYFGARVYVYEPTAENFAVLKENIAINRLGERVTAYPLAVSDRPEITLNIKSGAAGEVHASVHDYADEEKRVIRAVTPKQIFEQNGLDHVDLLKIDCEGGEFEIFPLLTPDLLAKVGALVFEWHLVVPDAKERAQAIFAQLRQAGFRVIEQGMVVSAVRGP